VLAKNVYSGYVLRCLSERLFFIFKLIENFKLMRSVNILNYNINLIFNNILDSWYLATYHTTKRYLIIIRVNIHSDSLGVGIVLFVIRPGF